MKPLVINSFQGPFRWLSNFWECTVFFGETQFNSVENAYVAAKLPEELAHLRLLVAKLSPGKAKRYGRGEINLTDSDDCPYGRISMREDWNDELRLSVMRVLIYQKFHPAMNPELCYRLLQTKEAQLIEGNNWHDEFFGVEQKKGGQNHLGRIIMEQRKELQLDQKRMSSFEMLGLTSNAAHKMRIR